MATAEVNYAPAPAEATHYDFFSGDKIWLKMAWLYFDDNLKNWDLCEQDEQPTNEKKIPARERELNRLVDRYSDFGDAMAKDYTFVRFTDKEWQQRRAERIEAGLIEVDNPVTSSLTNSQAKEMELDMLKGEKWMPEVGEKCEYRILGGDLWFPCTIRYILSGDHSPDADGWRAIAWCPHLEKDQMLTDANAEFCPLKTPEQKAKEVFLSKAKNMTDTEMLDYLTESGVDLTPLIKEQTK